MTRKPRKTQGPGYNTTGTFRCLCAGCGKRVFNSRKEAKTAAAVTHPGATMRVYRCVDSNVTPAPFHYTHMSALKTAAWKDYENERARSRRQQ